GTKDSRSWSGRGSCRTACQRGFGATRVATKPGELPVQKGRKSRTASERAPLGTLTFLCLGAANAILAVHTGVIYLPPSGHILMFTGVSLVDVRPLGAPNGGSTWHFAKRLTAWNTTRQRRRKWRRESANSCAATS